MLAGHFVFSLSGSSLVSSTEFLPESSGLVSSYSHSMSFLAFNFNERMEDPQFVERFKVKRLLIASEASN